MYEDFKEKIFANVMKKKIEDQLEDIGNPLRKFLKTFAFLFEDDYVKTLKILTESFINNYDEDINTFEFNYDYFASQVPQVSKDQLFENLMLSLSENVNATSTMNNFVEKNSQDTKEVIENEYQEDEDFPM